MQASRNFSKFFSLKASYRKLPPPNIRTILYTIGTSCAVDLFLIQLIT